MDTKLLITIVIGIVLAIVIGSLYILACRHYAKEQVRKCNFVGNNEDKAKTEAEDNFLKTAAQILGGATAAAFIVAFVYTFQKDSKDQELTVEQLNLTKDQIKLVRSQTAASIYTEAFKIFQNNGSSTSNIEANTGAIYLLETAVNIDPTYKESVTYNLVQYLRRKAFRERTPNPKENYRISSELDAAIRVLGRTAVIPYERRFEFALDNLKLAGANFGWLTNFNGLQLRAADLRGVNFSHAILTNADVSGSEMNDDNAFGQSLELDKKPLGWDEWQRYPYIAIFNCANLENTTFKNSGMRGALFKGTNLTKTIFNGVDLTRADFSQARNLDKAIFTSACAKEKPKWPGGFVCELKDCNIPEKERMTTCKFNSKTEKENQDAQFEKICNEL
jgi:hypothetical protein